MNRPNLDPPGGRPNIDRGGADRGNFVDRNRNQGPNRGPGNQPGPGRLGGPRGDGDRRDGDRRDGDRRDGDGRGPRDANRPDGGGPNFVDRNREGRDRDGRGPDGRDRDGRGPDGRGPDGRDRDGRDRDVAGPDRGDRDRDVRDRDGRGRDGRDFRDRDGRGRDGRPGGSRDNFVGRNFRGNYANFINGGQNWNNSWNRHPNWQNYGGDWRRSNWYGNYWGGGYRPRYSPWWGVVPGLGWNWGGWGWGYGWPQWGYGYGGWGGYGYGYGVGATYLQAPTTTVVYTPTVEQIEVAQDFYNLALESFQAARYDDAVQYCQHAMVDNPQNGEIILLMAQSLSALGQYDRAADAVRMAIEVLPAEQWGTVVGNYSRYYPEVQQYTDQLRKLEAEARQSGAERPELNFLLGYNYAYLNYPPQAVAQLDKTLDRQPQDTAAQKLRDQVATKAGIPARQVVTAAQQPAAAPPAPQQEQDPQAQTAAAPTEAELARAADFIEQGEEAMKAGKFREALSHWQHALVETPQNGGAILLVSQALFALGQYNDAAGAVQMGMQLLPEEDWGMVVKNFAQLYADPGEYAQQLKALEAARAAKADDPALRFLSGYQYGFLGHRDQAVRELDKALQLQPQDQGAKKLREMFAAQQSPVPVEGAPAPGE